MGDTIVCDKYRLGNVDGKYDESLKKLVRKGQKVTKDYFKQINANTQDSGLMFVEDKEATAEYYEVTAKQYEDRKARKNIGVKAVKHLADALKGIGIQETVPAKTEAEKPKEEKKIEEKNTKTVMPDGTPDETWERDHVIQWLDGQKDAEDKPLVYKGSLGIKRLINEVVIPFLAPKEEEKKDDETEKEGDKSQSTHENTEE